ncbi:hypothetical protein CU098_012760 [Rhizopus stolonifer]|uniref:Uncharacterized protein n=1 Tax=Rhizopus stolonifer TaxID=4846 RepID=A0A367KNZ1_RHIST|nr:hypothetical protein CU098_012760 [Rhizopus stolonifer]
MSSPNSTLLYAKEEEMKPSSYYKRGNLLATPSFRSKYTSAFRRSRSSSYTSLEDDKQASSNTSIFSRKNMLLKERANTASNKRAYSRQNLLKPSASWKSSVLKAVGIKHR